MLRRALLLAPLAASLVLVVLTPWCTRDRADVADFVAAAESHFRPGDTILVHPPWREDVVRALAPIGPATVALAPRHGEPLPQLLILKDRGAPPLPRALRRAVDGAPARSGEIEVLRLRGEEAARDIGAVLARARVSVRDGDRLVPCPYDARTDRHRCEGLPEWMYVGAQDLPVDGRTERCIWAHPRTDAVLRIELPATQLLDVVTLSLALTDGAADNAQAAPVYARLFLDDVEAGMLERRPGRRGFATLRVPVARERRALAVEITTPNDGQRHTCFRLRTEAG